MECTIPQSRQAVMKAVMQAVRRHPAGSHAARRPAALPGGQITIADLLEVSDLIDVPSVVGDGTSPYCTTCSEWVGLFAGMKGWHHFTGDPSPSGTRVLFDAGHKPSIDWTVPPGRSLSPAGVFVLRLALADAIAHHEGRAEGLAPALTDAYLALGRQLGIEVDQG